MDKLREITEYMENIKIKKVLVGGYDKKDVSQKIGTLMDMAKKCADEYEAEEKSIIADYEKRMSARDAKEKELQAEIDRLNEKIAELEVKHAEEISVAVTEKEKLRTAYKECCSSILTEYSESIRSLSVEFTQVLENVARLQRGLKENVIFEQLGVSDEE